MGKDGQDAVREARRSSYRDSGTREVGGEEVRELGIMTIYCDIDGTLTSDPHSAYGKPRPDIILKLKEAIELYGYDVVLWSGRSADYVKAFAEEHGINAIACLSKPNLVVDDKSEIRHLPKEDRYRPITPEEFLKREL